MLRQAVSEHGSEAAAARWVGTANTSAHVSGDAVDIGPFDATAWEGPLLSLTIHYDHCFEARAMGRRGSRRECP
jgi:hypothetical protein